MGKGARSKKRKKLNSLKRAKIMAGNFFHLMKTMV